MRIALVSREYPPETAKGGIATQTYAKAHGLAKLGHEVHVLSQSIDGVRRELNNEGVRVTRVPGFEQMPVHADEVEWLTYSAGVAAELAAMHERHSFDLVDFPEWGGEGYIHLLNRRDWNRRPAVVVHIHGSLVMFAETSGWPEKDSMFYRVGTEMERWPLRLADGIYSSSAYSAEWCVRHYGLENRRIPVMHTGVDTRLFRPLAGDPDAPRAVVYTGKVAASKGVLELFEACCRLRAEFPRLRLQLLGRADEKTLRGLIARANEAGAADLLEYGGFVEHRELPSRYSRCHVFASPSPCEGGPGLTLLEAMACGLPVIACEGTGAAEVVCDGNTGFLARPHDVESIADALRKLLANPELRRGMGAQARQYVEREAATDVCVARIADFYASVVGAHSRAEAGAA
jgi:glycosyltransferase involved in cell wall biosynthesis